jgi:hydrogenase-4 component E
MTELLDFGFVALLLLNFVILGTSRIRAAVHAVALQGMVLGLMPLLARGLHENRMIVIVVVTIGLKGIVLPRMLLRAIRNLNIRREVEPLIGLTPSLILGAIGTALALAFAEHLPLHADDGRGLLVPASLSTVLTGFIVLTTRVKAITQVLGYLVLENGIFIFGLLLVEALPFLVEVGVLLDLFVAVFVMRIVFDHITREIPSASTEMLRNLRD